VDRHAIAFALERQIASLCQKLEQLFRSISIEDAVNASLANASVAGTAGIGDAQLSGVVAIEFGHDVR